MKMAPVRMVSMTWQAMYLSGAGTGMTAATTQTARATTPQGRPLVRSAWAEVGAPTTPHRSCVRRIVMHALRPRGIARTA